MSWNYRVIRTRQRKKFPNGHKVDAIMYSIRSVYYDKQKRPDGVAITNAWPGGTTLKEIRADIIRMLAATHLPVLNYKKERAK